MSELVCPLCSKQFIRASALKQHLGTGDLTAAKSHTCSDCDQIYCSVAGLDTHRRNNDHTHILECSACNKRYTGNVAFAEHTRTCSPNSAGTAKASSTGGNTQPKKQKKNKQQKTIPSYSTFTKYPTSTISDFGQGYDFGLCDKDCGWCGNCMDNYDGDI